MYSLSHATQATIEIQIADRTLRLAPLTLSDLGQFCSYCQFRDYYQLKDAGVSGDALSEVLRDCRRTSVGMGSPAFSQTLETPDGIIELLYLSLRKHQPDLSKAWIGENLNAMNLQEIVESLASLSGLAATDDEKPPAQNRKKKRQQPIRMSQR